MIETSEMLRWALIIFAVSTGADGQESITHSAPSYYISYAACMQEGQRFLSVIDVMEGVEVRATCVPRDVVKP